MIRILHLVISALLFVCPLEAKAAGHENAGLAIDLAKDKVDITAGFSGANLTVFGTKEEPGTVVLLIRGPSQSMNVWRKDSIFGAWVNTGMIRFQNVPVYYDYALGHINQEALATAQTLTGKGIGINALHFHPEGKNEDKHEHPHDTHHHFRKYEEALIRNRQVESLLPLDPQPVHFVNERFFKAEFYVPSNVPTGTYEVQALLLQDGEIIAQQTRPLTIAQVGWNAEIRDFSRNYAFLYGVLCVILAAAAGALSNMLRRKA